MTTLLSDLTQGKTGSVIVIPDDLENRLKVYKTIDVAKSITSVLFVISESKEQVLSISEISDKVDDYAIKLSASSIRGAISRMCSIGILVKHKRRANEGKGTRAGNTYVFSETEDFINKHFNESSALDKPNEVRVDWRTARKDLLLAENIDQEDLVKDFSINIIYYLHGLVSQYIFNLAANKENGVRYRKSIEDKKKQSKKIIYEVFAFDQIPMIETMKTLMAVVQCSMEFKRRRMARYPNGDHINDLVFPIWIRTILDMRGMPDSGPNRRKIRVDLFLLRTSYYKITQVAVGKSNSEDFQFFGNLRSELETIDFSDLEEDEKKHKINIGVFSGNMFIISYTPKVNRLIHTEENIFTFPLEFNDMEPRVAKLYLNLRYYFSFKGTSVSVQEMPLKEVYKLGGDDDDTYAKYASGLKSELLKNHKVGTIEDGSDLYEVCGYEVSFFKKGREEYCLFKCDHKNVIKRSGATYNDSKKNNAPVIKNPIYQKMLDAKESNTMETVLKIISHEDIKRDIRRNHFDKSTLRLAHSRIIALKGVFEVGLTWYDSAEHINSVAEILSEHAHYDFEVCKAVLKELSSELKPVAYEDLVVRKKQFANLRDYVNKELTLSLKNIDIVDVIGKFRRVKVRLIVEGKFSEVLDEFKKSS